MTEPDNMVLVLLRDIRAGQAATNDRIDQVAADLRSEMQSLRADMASDILALHGKIDATRKDLSGQIVGLRRAVVEYHSAVIGHGVLISDIEARVRRLEQLAGISPDAH